MTRGYIHDNMFKPMLGFLKEDGEIDEEQYKLLMACMAQTGPDDFVDFLRTTLCTYPAVNDFLVKCLYIANQDREFFDT